MDKKKKISEAKRRINNMTQEQVKAAIEKKAACNARAQSIVEGLIEPGVNRAWLLENVVHINQSHFQDAVEERAISKYCGYPLCDSHLENVPSKMYYISTKQNKVFDLSDRKNYCSNLCYKSGVYLKEQLFTSPLWLRDCENAVDYKLYVADSPCGTSGLEVDLGNAPHAKPRDEMTSLEFVPRKESKGFSSSPTAKIDADPPSVSPSISSNTEAESSKVKSTAVRELIVEKSPNFDKRKSERADLHRDIKLKSLVAMGQKIEDTLLEWYTVDTLIFLLGDDKVKVKLKEWGASNDILDRRKHKDAVMLERYEELCRRLNVVELKESQPISATRPLPDYEQLKREAREINLKVRSFFMGDSQVAFVDSETDCEKKTEEDAENVLPLIDRHAIRTTRRRIVLDRLNKTLPDIQSALNLHEINLMAEVHQMAATLSFTSTNIILKPAEWNLVVIVFISLLTIRNDCLKDIFRSATTQKRLVGLLMTYNLDLNFLEKQIFHLDNIDRIIRNSV